MPASDLPIGIPHPPFQVPPQAMRNATYGILYTHLCLLLSHLVHT